MPNFKAGIVEKNLSTVQVGPLERIEPYVFAMTVPCYDQ